MTRIPSLDGLRAISILGVLIAHASISPGYNMPDNSIIWFFLGFVTGDHGVNIFFVISGFLITHLLIEEKGKTGAIDIKAFYFRRIFRIFPVYFFYLGFVFFCDHFRIVTDMDVKSFLPALTFTTGTIPIKTGWTIGHTWSLSVEEQFYIFWPTVLFFVKEKKTRNIIILSLMFATPLVRMWYYQFVEKNAYLSFFLRQDCLLMGCFLAINKEQIASFFKNRNHLRIVFVIVALTSYFLFQADTQRKFGLITVPFYIFSQGLFASALIILYSIIPRTESMIYKLLNYKLVSYFGVYSFSMYLWQQFFLQHQSGYFWKQFPINLVFSILAGITSYYLLETPFLKLRKRLSKV